MDRNATHCLRLGSQPPLQFLSLFAGMSGPEGFFLSLCLLRLPPLPLLFRRCRLHFRLRLQFRSRRRRRRLHSIISQYTSLDKRAVVRVLLYMCCGPRNGFMCCGRLQSGSFLFPLLPSPTPSHRGG